MEVIQIGKRKFKILFPDLLRPLTDREQTDLRKSIRKRGVVVPVIVDDGDGVIDGANRLRIAKELDLSNVPTTVLAHLTDDERKALALSLNTDRRHLTQEEKREAVAQALKAEPEKSNRQVAAEVGVDHKTVAAVRAEQESTGEIPQLDETVGADGKARPVKPKPIDTIRAWAADGLIGKRAAAELESLGTSAHKRFVQLINKGTSPADALKEMSREPGDDRPHPPPRKPPAPKGELRDKAGNVVPDHLRDVFADPGLGTLIGELEQVEAMIRPQPWLDRAAKLCDHYGFLLIDKFKEHAWETLHRLQLALEALRAGVPHAVCPKCKGTDSQANGKTCRGCRGYGFVPETRYAELTEDAA